jgi:hypothetical protein
MEAADSSESLMPVSQKTLILGFRIAIKHKSDYPKKADSFLRS